MIGNDQIKQNKLAKAIAALDSIIVSCREQQIELCKMLGVDLGVPEDSILNAIKECSIELLHKNGLDY